MLLPINFHILRMCLFKGAPFEKYEIHAFCEARRAAHLIDKHILKLSCYSLQGQSLIL